MSVNLGILVLAGVVTALVHVGCSGSPVASSNVPVRLDVDAVQEVQVFYTCRTNPRLYILKDGTHQMEIDSYTQPEPCPIVPID